jgi:hypothetical protein
MEDPNYNCPCGTPSCHKLYGHVRKDFVLNAVDPDLQSVPGITATHFFTIFKPNGIETTEQLVGNFFLCNRDPVAFREFLVDIGLEADVAKLVSEKFEKKFGGV